MRFAISSCRSAFVTLVMVLGSGCVTPVVVGQDRGDGSGEGSEGVVATESSGAVDVDTTETNEPATGDTSAESSCGNGIMEADELCDDAGETAMCDADCTEVECGDMTINAAAGEECDGIDLAGATCQTEGFGGGVLACGVGCKYDDSGCAEEAPELSLSFSQVKQFDFSWAPAEGAEYYQLLESASPGDSFVQVGENILGTSLSITVPLYARHEASYVLRACNVAACSDSDPVSVMESLAEAVGYFKASNTGAMDEFGRSVALSADGNTLAVGAYQEGSNATGVDGNQADDSAFRSGAVYVFVRDELGQWSQQGYIKASNTGGSDFFGWRVALSGDGTTLAVGADSEASNATGIDGDQADDSALMAGAAYVFVRDGAGQWSQQAYVKASNTDPGDHFGHGIALSSNGDTLAVSAPNEASNATGIDGNQADDSLEDAGAAYVFVRDGLGQWSQQAYIKASNIDALDHFGEDLALSGDGSTLAVGAISEGSNATGIDGDQANDSLGGAGAVYVFVRNELNQWSQQAYVKASNTDAVDRFGWSVALNGDGSTLAVGATWEDSSATGIDGDQANDSLGTAGAVYVFVRNELDQWSQQAYVKASNTDAQDIFGMDLALSGDGSMLAVGAMDEGSNATGIGGDQTNDSLDNAGAVYVFVRNELDQWSQQAYVKASNTDSLDRFGVSVALDGGGSTLAVGAWLEGSNAVGIGGDEADNSLQWAGAVYLY